MGDAPLNIFSSDLNLMFFNANWIPTETFPTVTSFTNHIYNEYVNYRTFHIFNID